MKRLLMLSSITACFALLVLGKEKVSNFDEFQKGFSTEKELKEKVMAVEWLSYTVAGKQFFIGRVPLISAGSSRERIACWLKDVRQGLVCVWDVRLREVGSVKLEIDKVTSRLSVTGEANTSHKGEVVASVVLSALGP